MATAAAAAFERDETAVANEYFATNLLQVAPKGGAAGTVAKEAVIYSIAAPNSSEAKTPALGETGRTTSPVAAATTMPRATAAGAAETFGAAASTRHANRLTATVNNS